MIGIRNKDRIQIRNKGLAENRYAFCTTKNDCTEEILPDDY